jgi:hypothetical protein
MMRMTSAISVILAAGGAILIWGVDADVAGVDLNVIGGIAIFVGLAGVAFALVSYARRPPVDRVTRRDYMAER